MAMSAVGVRVILTVRKAWTEFCSVAAVQCSDWEMGILRLKETKIQRKSMGKVYIFYLNTTSSVYLMKNLLNGPFNTR